MGERQVLTSEQLAIERMTEWDLQREHLAALNEVLKFDMWIDYSHTPESVWLEKLGLELRIRMAAV